jgi:DNA replication licensing factor MCM5
VEIEDLDGFDEDLGEKLKQQPSEYFQLFEDAATEIAGVDIQIIISSIAKTLDICELNSQLISRIVKIRGIVVSTSVDTKSKATKITIQCRSCNTISGVSVQPGLGGFSLPKKCTA